MREMANPTHAASQLSSSAFLGISTCVCSVLANFHAFQHKFLVPGRLHVPAGLLLSHKLPQNTQSQCLSTHLSQSCVLSSAAPRQPAQGGYDPAVAEAQGAWSQFQFPCSPVLCTHTYALQEMASLGFCFCFPSSFGTLLFVWILLPNEVFGSLLCKW